VVARVAQQAAQACQLPVAQLLLAPPLRAFHAPQQARAVVALEPFMHRKQPVGDEARVGAGAGRGADAAVVRGQARRDAFPRKAITDCP